MRKVKFSVDTGYFGSEIKEGFTLYVGGSEIEEEFTLDELGINEDEYESESELNKDINEAYDEWLRESVNTHWTFID